MKSPRYITDRDIQEIISLRGIRRPCEVSREYKIGLNRLYKIWSSVPDSKSAIYRGDPTEYIESKRRYMEKKRILAEEISSLRKELTELSTQRGEIQADICVETEELKSERTKNLEERETLKKKIEKGKSIYNKLVKDHEKIIAQVGDAVNNYNDFVNLIIDVKKCGDAIQFDDIKKRFIENKIFRLKKIFNYGMLRLETEYVDDNLKNF